MRGGMRPASTQGLRMNSGRENRRISVSNWNKTKSGWCSSTGRTLGGRQRRNLLFTKARGEKPVEHFNQQSSTAQRQQETQLGALVREPFVDWLSDLHTATPAQPPRRDKFLHENTELWDKVDDPVVPFLATSAMMLATLVEQLDWGCNRLGSRGRTPVSWIFILVSVSGQER